MQNFLPKRWWSSVIWITTSYFVASVVLPNVLLLIINCSGYLPYSDRPGPGWQPPHWPGKDEIQFFLGFALYMGIPALFYGIAHAVLGLIYGLCSLPKWSIRVLGGVTAFLSAGLLMEGAGWMIAISALGVYLAAGCGLLWGVLLLPLIVPKCERLLPLGIRIALPVLLACAGVFALISPMLPHKAAPGITFEANRLTESTDEVKVDNTPYFRPETWAELEALHLRGELHGGIQTTNGNSGDASVIEVLLIAEQPIDREYVLSIPESGHVVYVLRGGKLTPHPAFEKKDKREIVIKPGTDSVYSGGQYHVSHTDGQAMDGSFTWYPTIKK